MTYILYSAVGCTSLVHVDYHTCTCVHIYKLIVKCALNCVYIITVSHSNMMDNMMLLLLVLPLGAFSYRYDCK